MPLDDNDRAREGSLPTDPFEDTELVTGPPAGGWKEGADDGAPPRPLEAPELRTFADVYGIEQLEADRKRKLVSLAVLPGWPGGPPETGHGLGRDLNFLLGGGIHPGYMLAVGAAHAAAGKTALVAQLADGLALRTAEAIEQPSDAPLTPVVMLSEMGVPQLSWRSLARFTNKDSRIFRSGQSAAEAVPGITEYEVEEAWRMAREALVGPLGNARRFMLSVTPRESGPNLVDEVRRTVAAWKSQLEKSHAREVWPVLFVDPIQRWQDHGKSEVEALNELVEQLADAAQRDGLIVICTSDTNKDAAKGKTDGDTREAATACFRGSYKLFHLPDAALLLEAGDTDRTKKLSIAKNRWGPQLPDPKAAAHFHWNPSRASFTPFTSREAEDHADAERKAADVRETAKATRAAEKAAKTKGLRCMDCGTETAREYSFSSDTGDVGCGKCEAKRRANGQATLAGLT